MVGSLSLASPLAPLPITPATVASRCLVMLRGAALQEASGQGQHLYATVSRFCIRVSGMCYFTTTFSLLADVEPECPGLPDPANGVVTLSGTSPGSTATYDCNFGFIRLGDRTRICGPDGTWSGSAPRCVSK